jgi:hypothetical protein
MQPMSLIAFYAGGYDLPQARECHPSVILICIGIFQCRPSSPVTRNHGLSSYSFIDRRISFPRSSLKIEDNAEGAPSVLDALPLLPAYSR